MLPDPPAELTNSDSKPSDRRQHSRFPMHLEVMLRTSALSEEWIASRTHDVSAGGAFLESPVPLACGANLEYIVTLPSNLTRTTLPLYVRFFGRVVRVDDLPEKRFGIAVHNSNYRYLSREESEALAAFAANGV